MGVREAEEVVEDAYQGVHLVTDAGFARDVDVGEVLGHLHGGYARLLSDAGGGDDRFAAPADQLEVSQIPGQAAECGFGQAFVAGTFVGGGHSGFVSQWFLRGLAYISSILVRR